MKAMKGDKPLENELKKRIKKYTTLTESSIEKVKKKVIKQKEAKEILEMASNYLSDAQYFEKKGDLLNAFAALNYAYGWLDAGVRLNVFKTKDNKRFTIQ